MQLSADRVEGHRSSERRDVSLAQDGDRKAFERLYRAHVDRVHSLARRMAGVRHADDLTQEAFIRAWRKLETFRGDSSFGTWLYRLATNLILDRRRAIGRRRDREVGDEEFLRSRPAPSRTPGLSMDLEAAVEELPDGAREIFVLYDVEGHTHGEIAELLEISVGTSKSQLHRARALLRERLS